MGDVNIGDVHHHHLSSTESSDAAPTDELPADVLSDEPVMPEIPIKPNNAIPVTIGVLLILGALAIGFSAYTNLSTEGMSADEAQVMADALNSQGAELTSEQVQEYFDELADAGYFTTLGAIELVASLVLLTGGVLLLLKRKLGVWLGIGGGSLVLLDAIVGFVILSGVEPPSELLSISMKLTSGVGIGCGLLCLALPFVPLLIATGRAALD